MSNQQNVAEVKVAEVKVAEPTQAAKEAEKARLKQEYKAWIDNMTSEERAQAYKDGLLDNSYYGGYRKKSRKGKKSKRRNTRRRRGRRSRKHRMR